MDTQRYECGADQQLHQPKKGMIHDSLEDVQSPAGRPQKR
jgi:hypothetical protein